MIKQCDTYWVKIFIAGPIAEAEQIIRRSCAWQGLCVTVEPTKYIYTGGEEQGYVVGLINYPRFPQSASSIWLRAKDLADALRVGTYQDSYTLMAPDKTEWFSIREKE